MKWNEWNDLFFLNCISLLRTVMPSKIKYSDKFSYDIFFPFGKSPTRSVMGIVWMHLD